MPEDAAAPRVTARTQGAVVSAVRYGEEGERPVHGRARGVSSRRDTPWW